MSQTCLDGQEPGTYVRFMDVGRLPENRLRVIEEHARERGRQIDRVMIELVDEVRRLREHIATLPGPFDA